MGENIVPQAPSQPSPSATTNTEDVRSWRQCVNEWFPDLDKRAHFMPHVHMNRVKLKKDSVGGASVDVWQSPEQTSAGGGQHVLQRSGVRDDMAQQHVLHCLRAVADGLVPGLGQQVMFVLSQMRYEDYLTNAAAKLPRPKDLENMNLERGDFDVLIIHRTFGLLVGEIKSVGGNAAERGLSEDKLLVDVQTALRKMMKLSKRTQQTCLPIKSAEKQEELGQLEKAREVLCHLTSDLDPKPRVRASLILPFITSQQLRRVLESDAELNEAFCKGLDVSGAADPVELCLCSDQISSSATPWEFSDDVLEKMGHWWRRCFLEYQPDPAMSDDVYEEIVSRFAGPASVVSIYCRTDPRRTVMEMRTKAQAVDETHKRLTRIALFPSQVDVLQENRDLVTLKGPPGTGKTLMLVLKAMWWAMEKQPVYIVNTRDESLAATCLIRQQIKETLSRRNNKSAATRVGVRSVTTGEADDGAVKLLLKAARNGQLCIIADEADGQILSALYRSLTSSGKIKRLRLWAAGVKCANFPEDLHVVTLTDPLRCPPSVVRQLEGTKSLKQGEVPTYTTPSAPRPTDGPPVIDLHHSQERGHDADATMECEKCGLEIGELLRNILGVGREMSKSDAKRKTEPAITFRDVLILTWDRGLLTEKEGSHRVQPSHKVVTGLRKAGMPVTVIAERDTEGIEQLAEMKGRDAVTLTGVYNVWGLERKVVVWLGRGGGTVDPLRKNRDYDETGGRLYTISRCTAQLIWVHDDN